MHAILCSNVVNDAVETSQREIPTADWSAMTGGSTGQRGFRWRTW